MKKARTQAKLKKFWRKVLPQTVYKDKNKTLGSVSWRRDSTPTRSQFT